MKPLTNLPIIQSLWIGDKLSVMEQLSIASFIQNGHPFHLYTYGPVESVPEKAIIMDANELIPESVMQQHRSLAGFSDVFRYKLLYERGNYWCDTDLVCLKPLTWSSPYVFSSEYHIHSGLRFWIKKKKFIGSCVIKSPSGSPIMKHCYDVASRQAPSDINRDDNWGVIGPTLLQNAIRAFNFNRYVMPPEVFCPVDFTDWRDLISKPHDPEMFKDARAVHLWNEFWRANKVDKAAIFGSDCIYEYLKAKYLKPAGIQEKTERADMLRCSSS